MGVSLLGLFMTIFYLFIVATRLETELSGVTVKPTRVSVIRDGPIKLFLLNGPLNAGSSAIGGLIVSSSTIQTVRESIVLVYGICAFVVVYFSVFSFGIKATELARNLPLTTIRVMVETCLLSAIALPMGVYSKLSQFTSALVGVAIIGVSLRNLTILQQPILWYIDRFFRAASVLVLAPTILFPVFVTSSVEYKGSSFLIYPTIVFSVMVTTIVALTGAKLKALHAVFDTAGGGRLHTTEDLEVSSGLSERPSRLDVLSVLFLVFTALVKALIVPEQVILD